MPANIRDVAREAGVSPATVSRTFNKPDSVGPKYVSKVRKAAEKLGYRPNVMARNLRTKTSNVIALIIPDVGNTFHTYIARGVEDEAREAGYSVLLGNTDENAEREKLYLEVSQMQQVAGVLLCPHNAELDVSEILDQNIPLVAMDRRMDTPVDTVVSSSFKGAYGGTKHLIDEGWERVACITGPEDVDTARLRADGYRKAVTEAGLEPIVHHATFDIEGGRQAVRDALSSENPPDAVITSNEPMSLGAASELLKRGYKFGKDIGFVGFDDSAWARIVDPPLTVVEQQPYEIGAQAARMLIEHLDGETKIPPRYVEFPTSLIIRGSSKRPNTKHRKSKRSKSQRND